MREHAIKIAEKLVAFMNAIPQPVAVHLRTDALAMRLLRPLINRLVPTGPTWVVVRSGPARGLQLLINPRSEKFYWTGTHEVAVQQAIAEILKPRMTFWDSGAHIGFFSLLASRCVGAAGSVHAFEPLPENGQRLLGCIERNGLKNITVHERALSGTGGEAVLHAYGSSLVWTLVPERGQ